MPMPVAEVEEVRFFNELIHLDPADLDRAGQIEWRLRAKVKGQPRNWAAQVALLQALVQQGKALGALDVADEVWPAHAALKGQELDVFQAQLFGLGRYEQASELMPGLQEPGLLPTNEVVNRRLNLAWQVGDMRALRQVLADLDPKNDGGTLRSWKEFCSRIEQAGLAPHLLAHQQIVRASLAGHQVFASLSVTASPDEAGSGPELTQEYYLAGDYRARTEMEEGLHVALQDFYSGLGLGDAPFWHLMTPMLLNVASRPIRARRGSVADVAH